MGISHSSTVTIANHERRLRLYHLRQYELVYSHHTVRVDMRATVELLYNYRMRIEWLTDKKNKKEDKTLVLAMPPRQ